MHSDNFFGITTACGILVSPSGIKPTPPAEEAQSLIHWTARDFPQYFVLFQNHEAHKSFSICPWDKEKISRGFKPRNIDALLGVNSTS